MATTKSPMPFARSTTMLRTSSTSGPTGPSAPTCRAAGSAMTSGGNASWMIGWLVGALTSGLLCWSRSSVLTLPFRARFEACGFGRGAGITSLSMLGALWSDRGRPGARGAETPTARVRRDRRRGGARAGGVQRRGFSDDADDDAEQDDGDGPRPQRQPVPLPVAEPELEATSRCRGEIRDAFLPKDSG